MRELSERITRLHAKAAFVRRDALHKWTTGIIARADDLTVIVPEELKPETGEGDAQNWGAEVGTVAMVNRDSLSLAIGVARDMLTYKAAEAGIRCDVITDASGRAELNRSMRRASKQSRFVTRQLRKKGQ